MKEFEVFANLAIYFKNVVSEIVLDIYKNLKKFLIKSYYFLNKKYKIMKIRKRFYILRQIFPKEYSALFVFYSSKKDKISQKFIPMNIAKELKNQGFISIVKNIKNNKKMYIINNYVFSAVIDEFNKNNLKYIDYYIFDYLLE